MAPRERLVGRNEEEHEPQFRHRLEPGAEEELESEEEAPRRGNTLEVRTPHAPPITGGSVGELLAAVDQHLGRAIDDHSRQTGTPFEEYHVNREEAEGSLMVGTAEHPSLLRVDVVPVVEGRGRRRVQTGLYHHVITPYLHPQGHGELLAEMLAQRLARDEGIARLTLAPGKATGQLQESISRMWPLFRIPIVGRRAKERLAALSKEANGTTLGDLLRQPENRWLIRHLDPKHDVFAQALVHALGSADAGTVDAARARLETAGVDERVKALTPAILTHPDAQVREHAAGMIGRLKGRGLDRSLQAIVNSLHQATPEGFETAVGLLGQLRQQDRDHISRLNWPEHFAQERAYTRLTGFIGVGDVREGNYSVGLGRLAGLADYGRRVEDAGKLGSALAAAAPDDHALDDLAERLSVFGPAVLEHIRLGSDRSHALYARLATRSQAHTAKMLETQSDGTPTVLARLRELGRTAEADDIARRAIAEFPASMLGALTRAAGPAATSALTARIRAENDGITDSASAHMHRQGGAYYALEAARDLAEKPDTAMTHEEAARMIREARACALKMTSFGTQNVTLHVPRAAIAALSRFAPEEAADAFMDTVRRETHDDVMLLLHGSPEMVARVAQAAASGSIETRKAVYSLMHIDRPVFEAKAREALALSEPGGARVIANALMRAYRRLDTISPPSRIPQSETIAAVAEALDRMRSGRSNAEQDAAGSLAQFLYHHAGEEGRAEVIRRFGSEERLANSGLLGRGMEPLH